MKGTDDPASRGASRGVSPEVARVEEEYRRVLGTAVAFEKRIRDRWRERCREKNARIAELEATVARLRRRLEEGEEDGP